MSKGINRVNKFSSTDGRMADLFIPCSLSGREIKLSPCQGSAVGKIPDDRYMIIQFFI